MRRIVVMTAVLLSLAAPAAHAAGSALHLELSTGGGDFERRSVVYDCGTAEPVQVTYINAAPNFLALVPIAEEPEPLLFAAVIAASGARYAAGQWIWWSRGTEASLYDATLGEDAEPMLTCLEVINTP